jgi:serine/threonine-protein kinase HipA
MKCLLCYKVLDEYETDYHLRCVKKIFGLKEMPLIDIDEKKLKEYAKVIVEGNTAITGVQPKLSLWLGKSKKNVRFTIIDSKSDYIIKPQSETYQSLPENEDLCMHLAEAFGINTAIHGLVRLPGGNLAYITKRFDRLGEHKLACEDMCQLTETLTEHKYRSSYEKIGKTLGLYSMQSGLDALDYFTLVVFSFVTGNADMHLKNFAMLEKENGLFSLSPAYDLVSTILVIKNEEEQLCLSLNGKKNKIKKDDCDALAKSLSLTERQRDNCYQSFLKKLENTLWWIDNSFLPEEQKAKLAKLMTTRIHLLNS